MATVKEGDKAPDFIMPSTVGEISLKDFSGKKAVILFFYPKDGTPGCTTESCAFRDSYEEFKNAGAEVIGVSSDSIESHHAFAEKYRLNFIIVSDPEGKLRKLYGVPSTFGLFPGRVTYLIGKDGTVKNIFNSQLNIEGHVQTALKILREEAVPPSKS
jgi:peroxiredoxin Q/BCP